MAGLTTDLALDVRPLLNGSERKDGSGRIDSRLSGIESKALDPLSKPRIIQLAALIDDCYEEARFHFDQDIAPRLQDCLRRKKGEYSPDRLAKIREQGGSQNYANITETKITSALAWLSDILVPPGQNPFKLIPTPIPSLSEADLQKAAMAVQIALSGQNPTSKDIIDLAIQVRDQMFEEAQQIARKKAEAHQRLMEDQLVDGGWKSAMADFLRDLTEYPYAILKGPVIRKKRKLVYKGDQVIVKEVAIPTWECTSPWDLLPAPNARTVNDNYVIERLRMHPSVLRSMKGQSGWKDEAIDGAILDHKMNKTDRPSRSEAELAERERSLGRRPEEEDRVSTIMEGVSFWGAVPVADLLEWGMSPKELGETDPTAYVEINAIKFGPHVVHAILNPDPLGERPYYLDSWERVSGALIGRSIAEKMADCQDNHNATIRNMINNIALAAGPQVKIDIDALDPATDPTSIFPGKTWMHHGAASSAREAVDFFQPKDNTQWLLPVAQYFKNESDDRTGIPRFVHGDDKLTGAGETATGVTILQNNATRNVKLVIGNVENQVVLASLKQLHRWNMLYSDDESIKADTQVVALGVLWILTQDANRVRQLELLQLSGQPGVSELMKPSGLAHLLTLVAQGMNIPAKELLPDESELEEMDRRAFERRELQHQMEIQQVQAAALQAQGVDPEQAGGPA